MAVDKKKTSIYWDYKLLSHVTTWLPGSSEYFSLARPIYPGKVKVWEEVLVLQAPDC